MSVAERRRDVACGSVGVSGLRYGNTKCLQSVRLYGLSRRLCIFPALRGLELASIILSDVRGCGLFVDYTHAEKAAKTIRTDVSECCSSLTVL